MKCSVKIDRFRDRVVIQASGHWSMRDADDFHDQMALVRQRTDRNSAISLSILSDLDGLVLHTAEIADRVAKTVEEMRFIRISQYALVVPSYLMRMQCRRLLDGIPHTIFDTAEEARQWLGWSADYGSKAA
jgi:hypothetical protein